MKINILRCLSILVFVVPMSACPPSTGILPGLWVIFLDGDSNAIGLKLLSNGTTEDLDSANLPPGVDTVFNGLWTWSQSGDVVTLVNNNGGIVIVYSGLATDRTAIDGT